MTYPAHAEMTYRLQASARYLMDASCPRVNTETASPARVRASTRPAQLSKPSASNAALANWLAPLNFSPAAKRVSSRSRT